MSVKEAMQLVGKEPKVIIEDQCIVPLRYCNVTLQLSGDRYAQLKVVAPAVCAVAAVTIEPDMPKLREALNRGANIPGVRLEDAA